jgi:hypothetical protein
MAVTAGTVKLPADRPGIGFEAKQALRELFETLDATSTIRDI